LYPRRPVYLLLELVSRDRIVTPNNRLEPAAAAASRRGSGARSPHGKGLGRDVMDVLSLR
jgi:hypothetical protein